MADNKFKVVGLSNLKTFYDQLKEKFALKVDGNKKVLYTDAAGNNPMGYTKAEIDAKLSTSGGGTTIGGSSVLFVYPTNNDANTFTTVQNNFNNKVILKRVSEYDETAELFNAISIYSDQLVFSRFLPSLNTKNSQDDNDGDSSNIENWNPDTYNLGDCQTLNNNNGNPSWTFDTIDVVNATDTITKIRALDEQIAALEEKTYTKNELEQIIAEYIANNSKDSKS